MGRASLIVCSFLAAFESFAGVQIGGEALLTLPPSAKYNLVVNDRPRDGETVYLNPPRISWSYSSVVTNSDTETTPYTFRFRLGTNSNMSTPDLDIPVPSNAYNFLGPLRTNITWYWQASYTNATNGAFVADGSIRSFTVSVAATNWDRSMLSNLTFMATNFSRPHFFWHSNNLSAITNYLNTNNLGSLGTDWQSNTNLAYQVITNAWWTNSTNPSIRGMGTNSPFWSPGVNDGGWQTWFARVLQAVITFAQQNDRINMTNAAWQVANVSTFLRQFQQLLSISITNQPTTGDSITLGSHTAVWTNNTPASTNFIRIGASKLESGTNLFSWSMQTNVAQLIMTTLCDGCLVGVGTPDLTFYSAPSTTFTHSIGAWAKVWGYSTNSPLLYQDPVTFQHEDGLRAVAIGYSHLYDVLTTAQQTNLLYSCDLGSHWLLKGATTYEAPYVATFDPSAENPFASYTGGFYVDVGSQYKRGSPHPLVMGTTLFPLALAARNDSTWASNAVFTVLNMIISRPYSFGDDGHLNQGRGYEYEGLFNGYTLVREMYICSVLPGVNLQQNPFWIECGDRIRRITPVGFKEEEEPWGLLGNGGYITSLKNTQIGGDMAAFLNDGKMFQHWTNCVALDGALGANPIWKIPLYYLFPMPTVGVPDPITDRYYPYGGVAIGSSYPPNTRSNYNQGIGFIIQSRPSGRSTPADYFSDLDIQLWQDGVTITASGYNFSTAGNVSWYRQVPTINGHGTGTGSIPVREHFGSLLAFTNTTAFTYAAVDGTYVYSHEANTGVNGGAYVPSGYTNALTGASVTKMNRHLLMNKTSKSFNLFDVWEATQTNTYSWIWQIPLGSSNLQVNASAGTFSYGVTNSTTSSNVDVYVKLMIDPTTVTLTNMAAGNAGINPITGEDYSSFATAGTFRTNAIWVTSKTPSTNWAFGAAIAAVPHGESAPTLTRISDYTVIIGGTTNTFDTNYQSAFTYMIDIGATNAPPSPPPAPPSLIQVSKTAGKMKLSGNARGQ